MGAGEEEGSFSKSRHIRDLWGGQGSKKAEEANGVFMTILLS